MKAVKYKIGRDDLAKEYLKLLDVEDLKAKVDGYNLSLDIEDVLIGDITTLVKCRNAYLEHTELKKRCVKDFDYDKHSGAIAEFFIKYVDTSTCHYCDMAYINTYIDSDDNNRRVFELDHYIPRSECPLLALSLFNLVPSCQYCNQRIKHSKKSALNDEELIACCPTYENYHFEEDVQILPIPMDINALNYNPDTSKQLKHFRVRFFGPDIYQSHIKELKLEDRYQYHLCEALRMKDKCDRYTKGKIDELSKLLDLPSYTLRDNILGPVTIRKEDALGIEFDAEYKRTMAKFRKDTYNIYYPEDK